MSNVIVACGTLKIPLEKAIEALHEDERPDIIYLPAIMHLYPDKLSAAINGLLASFKGIYSGIIVVYGKCAYRIDEIVNQHGAIRVPGELCYAMYVGEDIYREMLKKVPGTYFLTDDICRNFNKLVVEPLDWKERPRIKEMMLRNYQRVVYLDVMEDNSLDKKAREIADFLNLPLEIQRIGSKNFETLIRQTLKEIKQFPKSMEESNV
ncbi:DUF1638 domain-containing protein [Dehalobacterium formicoaceticum]|uniref:DUF1638 domain-containing protein n=1 Tax=Dehalobacterium formicoaceticum TaxID=51515 RepID=UPI000B7E6F75|nr:DUF1638 domain-containing protein [Dehalobacterium formicoaceticum]